jgi:hypothetical protein
MENIPILSFYNASANSFEIPAKAVVTYVGIYK